MLCRFAVIGSACESSCARLLLCCSCSPVRLHGLHLDLEDISMPFLHHFSIPASKGGDCMLAVPLCAWERAVGGGSDLSKQSRPGMPACAFACHGLGLQGMDSICFYHCYTCM
uniref:Uncharacterized protein n=1 Tax=Setaria viridis TaxID=4556 RepID=A0A4U6W9Y0_SETVI|nr:hypothetical protein SEVIR_1G184666v2 [Setaria viridis]TKW39520.1 hypothetical protein SEVIR_1G184666v2 [Setaria viridis]